MRTYKKLHETNEKANIHIAKIEKRGGTVISKSEKDGKILLEYDFKTDDDVDAELDKIFNELRDRYGVDDSQDSLLTKYNGKEWVVVKRDSSFLTPRSKMLVNKYYNLMLM